MVEGGVRKAVSPSRAVAKEAGESAAMMWGVGMKLGDAFAVGSETRLHVGRPGQAGKQHCGTGACGPPLGRCRRGRRVIATGRMTAHF